MRSSCNKKERDFFDNRYSKRTKKNCDSAPSNLSLFYARSESKRFYIDHLHKIRANDKVLEYGCGMGSSAHLLAGLGAKVCGVDISEVAIKQAHLKADQTQLNNLSFHVMDAEKLAFSDLSFDLICGTGILHHLHLEKAFGEIARVLKPTGKAIFKEPLGYNPLLKLYRILTPHLHTIDEHPLLKKDFQMARRYFNKVEVHYFDLLTLAVIPFMKFSDSTGLLEISSRLDQKIFHIFPYLKYWAGIVILVLSETHQLSAKG